MSKLDIGRDILEGIRDIKACKAGKKNLCTHRLNEPAPPQVIRTRLKLSQATLQTLWV